MPAPIPRALRPGRLSEPLDVLEGLARLPHRSASMAARAAAGLSTTLRFAFYGTRALRPAAAAAARPAAPSTRPATRSGRGRPDLCRAHISRPRPRPRSRRMVDNIKAAFDRRLEALDWMAPATKRGGADARSETIVVGVGYPDRWRDYSALEIRRRRRLRQPEERRSSPNIATSSPSSASRSTAANGGCRRSWSTPSTCRCRTR